MKHSKQHWIPQSYLSAWCVTDGYSKSTPYVWLFNKEEEIGEKKAPKNIFFESNMYTKSSDEAERDLSLELTLSKIEDDFSRLRSKKITAKSELTAKEKTFLCIYVATMHCRSKVQKDHLREQWSQAYRIGEEMRKNFESKSEEDKRKFSSKTPHPESGTHTLSYEDVKKMVDQPLQTLLLPMAEAESLGLAKMGMTIITSECDSFFITSDAPCVWFDPEIDRTSYHNAPGLGSKTIEVTMPLSPRSLLFFCWRNMKDSLSVDNPNIIEELNRRTRFHAHQFFISNRVKAKREWFSMNPFK